MAKYTQVGSDMIKVKNSKVVSEIARTTYRGNRKRNLLTILAICLTTFMVTVIIALGISYWDTISMRMIRMEGMDYDIALSEPNENQVEIVRSMENVKAAGLEVKCGIIESYNGISLEKTRMYWIDKICLEQQSIPAMEYFEGCYPEAENEIMLSYSAAKSLGIDELKIGMKLKFKYYTLNNSDTEDEIIEKEFILSGYYKNYSGRNYAYISETFLKGTGVKQTDFTQGMLRISLKNPLYSETDIINMEKQVNKNDNNNQYISADYHTISNFCKTVAGLVIMLIIVFACGYLFIYNTLYISITKDIRYYGQLKTIGMTSKQLKAMIYKQALWNSLFGIPIGLVIGFVIVSTTVPTIIKLVNPVLTTDEIMTIHPWVYVIAVVFAFATNMISSRKPAIIAANSSPIEAVRYLPLKNSRYKHSSKYARVQKRERVHKGGGLSSMALTNIFRDKKQAFIILLSFVIALSIFVIVNVVIKGKDAKSILDSRYSYDVQFINETILEENKNLLTDEKIAQIESIQGVKSVSKVTSTKVIVPYKEDVFAEFFKSLYASRYSPGNLEEGMKIYKENPESGMFAPRFIGIDEIVFDEINKSLGETLNKEAFKNGEIAVIDNFFMNGADEGMSGKIIEFFFPKDDKEHSIKIAAVVPRGPEYFAGGYVPNMIVSEKYAKKILGNTLTELINVVYDESYSQSTDDAVLAAFKNNKQVSNSSKLERYQEMRTSEMQVKIIGNTIALIIALLALLNYVNMMAASVQNRAKEFATLESIGMTSVQLKKVLAYEGVGYAVISIILSLLIGIPTSVLVFNSMNIDKVSYVLPWLSNGILIVVTLILCTVVPVMIYQKTKRESIVDRLRKAVD